MISFASRDVLARIALACVCVASADACCAPTSVKVTSEALSDGSCKMYIDWDGGGALGLYIIPPEMKGKIPRGWKDFDGRVYWGVDTTKFPDGFLPTVTVGEFPDNGEDSKIAQDKDPIPGTDDDVPYLDDGDAAPLIGKPVVIAVVTVPATLYFDEIESFECGETYGSVPRHLGLDE